MGRAIGHRPFLFHPQRPKQQDRDGRGWLLTDPVAVPARGEIPRHERYYYLELLRRAGVIERIPASDSIRLEGCSEAAGRGALKFGALGIPLPVIGVSPGAAYGGAKRWLAEGASPEEIAARLGRTAGGVHYKAGIRGFPCPPLPKK